MTKNIEYTTDEKLIIGIDKKSKSLTKEEQGIIRSLKSQFIAKHFLTPKQRLLCKSLIKRKTSSSEKKAAYYLYAIATDRDVKLGFSSNPSKRLYALQTSNSTQLRILWKCYAGETQAEAINNERRLHKVCKKHKINREWFSLDCMSLVRKYKPKNV